LRGCWEEAPRTIYLKMPDAVEQPIAEQLKEFNQDLQELQIEG